MRRMLAYHHIMPPQVQKDCQGFIDRVGNKNYIFILIGYFHHKSYLKSCFSFTILLTLNSKASVDEKLMVLSQLRIKSLTAHLIHKVLFRYQSF